MGFTPAQVDEMTMWQFAACVEGYNRAHGDNKPQPPSEEEFDTALAEWENVYGSAAIN